MPADTHPLVSIAIPTYNRAGTYLRCALEGAISQKYAELEIVVSDNGSTDNTEEVVRSYRDPRIRYFKKEKNIVPNENFNFCLQQVRGDYFLLLLDDEQIDPDFVETCLHAANYRTDVGLIRTGLRTIDANGSVIAETYNDAGGLGLGDFFIAWFEGRTTLYLCNTLFNRRALIDTGGFYSRHNMFQDVMAQVRVASRLPRIDVRDIKATTRRHLGQFTFSAKVQAWCEDSLDLLGSMCALAGKRETAVRDRGMRFFTMINYSRANAIRSPLGRLGAYRMVYKLFGGKYLPSARMVLSSTALYRELRRIKRKLKGQPAWAAD